MSDMLPPKDKMCHRTGFEKSCRTCVVEHGCELWKQLQGKNPATGEDLNRYGCLDGMIDILMIDMVRQQVHTKAAVESMRNEVVKLSVEGMARQERQHREMMQIAGADYNSPPPPGITVQKQTPHPLLTETIPDEEPN